MPPWLKPAVKLAIVALLVWFLRGTLKDALQQIEEHHLTLDLGWLVASGVLYLLGQLPSALFWHRLLRKLGQDARWYPTLRAWFIGQLGKYVPGKALVVVLRAGFIRGPRVDTAVAAVTVFVETLTTMAVGGFLAGAILALQARGNWKLLALAFGLMIVTGVPTLPPIFKKLIRFLRVGRANPHATAQAKAGANVTAMLDRLDYGTLAAGWPGITIGWVLMGASLWAVLQAMGLHHLGLQEYLLPCTAAIALAVVAGFLSFIPGGAFVREAVLLGILANFPAVDDGTALVSAVVFRLVSVVAEVVLAGLLYAARPRQAVSAISD